MKRFPTFVVSLALLVAIALSVRVLADEQSDGPPPRDNAAPGGPEGPAPGGPGGPGPRGGPGFHLLPRHVVEQLRLTADQQKQLAELEKETKAKLEKMLTPKQRKILQQAGPPRPGQGFGGGQPGGRRGPPPGGAGRGPEGGTGDPSDDDSSPRGRQRPQRSDWE